MTSKEQELCIQKIKTPWEEGFAVCFGEYRVGAKYNFGPGPTRSFPWEVIEVHNELNSAREAYDKMVLYIRDKVKQVKEKKNKTSNPSYYIWK